jgi:hypothetical protein
MALSVGLWEYKGNVRSKILLRALAVGLTRHGYKVTWKNIRHWKGNVGFDAAMLYGYMPPIHDIIQAHKAAEQSCIHLDLGYFGRTEGGTFAGYHKFARNARHPDAYFQRRKHPNDRIDHFNLKFKANRRKGRHILIAGASNKQAFVDGVPYQTWERSMITEIRKHTDRPIYYRPKPGDGKARPIEGTEYAQRGSLQHFLTNCHAVVTHHSNMCIDAILEGVPCFSEIGVGCAVGYNTRDIHLIETPFYPHHDHIRQWLADVAYQQWNVAEMKNGDAIEYLRQEGLFPK